MLLTPPNAKLIYLNKLCEMLDKVCDLDNEIYVLGDININWNMVNCQLKEKLLAITNACNLVQMVDKPTTLINHNLKDRSKSATCTDHVFTNFCNLCSNAVSIPVG